MCDQLLACPGRTGDECCPEMRRHMPDFGEQRKHLRRASNQPLEVGCLQQLRLEARTRLSLLQLSHNHFYPLDQPFRRDRLLEVVRQSVLNRPDRILDRVVRCHQHGVRIRIDIERSLDDSHAIGVRQLVIDQHDVRALRPNQRQSGLPVRRRKDAKV